MLILNTPLSAALLKTVAAPALASGSIVFSTVLSIVALAGILAVAHFK